ncbi:MAG: hypothetical protein QXK42_03815 [Candidatus Korarchaeum sp.]
MKIVGNAMPLATLSAASAVHELLLKPDQVGASVTQQVRLPLITLNALTLPERV